VAIESSSTSWGSNFQSFPGSVWDFIILSFDNATKAVEVCLDDSCQSQTATNGISYYEETALSIGHHFTYNLPSGAYFDDVRYYAGNVTANVETLYTSPQIEPIVKFTDSGKTHYQVLTNNQVGITMDSGTTWTVNASLPNVYGNTEGTFTTPTTSFIATTETRTLAFYNGTTVKQPYQFSGFDFEQFPGIQVSGCGASPTSMNITDPTVTEYLTQYPECAPTFTVETSAESSTVRYGFAGGWNNTLGIQTSSQTATGDGTCNSGTCGIVLAYDVILYNSLSNPDSLKIQDTLNISPYNSKYTLTSTNTTMWVAWNSVFNATGFAKVSPVCLAAGNCSTTTNTYSIGYSNVSKTYIYQENTQGFQIYSNVSLSTLPLYNTGLLTWTPSAAANINVGFPSGFSSEITGSSNSYSLVGDVIAWMQGGQGGQPMRMTFSVNSGSPPQTASQGNSNYIPPNNVVTTTTAFTSSTQTVSISAYYYDIGAVAIIMVLVVIFLPLFARRKSHSRKPPKQIRRKGRGDLY
jgi:hypothetical protein